MNIEEVTLRIIMGRGKCRSIVCTNCSYLVLCQFYYNTIRYRKDHKYSHTEILYIWAKKVKASSYDINALIFEVML